MQSTTTITTRDGQAPAHLFQPARSGGPWPAVIVYMDARGIRPALFELAERVASAGYVVLLPDLFYRAGAYEAPTARAFSADPELRQRWFAKYVSSATPANVLSDTQAFLEFLAAQVDVRGSLVGTTGYCMGGGLALAAAGRFPERVAAAASFHGGNLATDAADSPHRAIPSIRGRVYVAGAVDDASFPDEQKAKLIDALKAAGVSHTVETYAGARHGWVPSDSAVYDPDAAERHYRALLSLFDATLKREKLAS